MHRKELYIPADEGQRSDGQLEAFANAKSNMDSMESKILDGIHQYNDVMKQEIRRLTRDMSRLAEEQARQIYDDQSKKTEARQRMVDHWRVQNEQSLNRILEKVNHLDNDQKQLSYQRKALNSLYFDKIDDRQNMIDEKQEATLGWVFNPPVEKKSQWSEVPTWLRGSSGLYWVSGKAGSGKSTLMKWLFHQNQTRDLLQMWAGGQELLITKYFFWSPGDALQKSLSGLLRSFLYDLLQQRPSVISQISPARWRSYDLELAHFPAWTDADLLIAIRTFIQETAQNAHICLFIDGLDEFEGRDHQRIQVVDLLKELSLRPNIKICVSSRPWELFKDSFAGSPMLRLEVLSRNDIENYINENLRADVKFEALRQKDRVLCSQLVCEIIEKAKGVWLWVILVVRSLLQGLRNRDTGSDLLDRLKMIPGELEKFFLQMFHTIEEFYRPKALRLFKIAMEHSSPTLMTLSFLDGESASLAFEMPTEIMNEDEIQERLALTGSRLNIRCLGLLETVTTSDIQSPFRNPTVEFLHRSAQDFLLNAKTQELMGMESVASFDTTLFLCKSLLAQMKILSFADKALSFSVWVHLLHEFFSCAARLEAKCSTSLLPLLDVLSQILGEERYKSILNWARTSAPSAGYRRHSSKIAWTWASTSQGPCPLLSLSIQYGLGRYAKQILESNPALVAKQPGRPLLDFALRRKIYSLDAGTAEQLEGSITVDDQPDVELVRMILAYGADPNEEFGRSTMWKLFLKFLDLCGKELRIRPTMSQPFLEVTELLIRYGAVRILESETKYSGLLIDYKPRQTLARDSIAAAFGEAEAARLDSLSWRLSATGMNLLTKSTRAMRSSCMRAIFG